MAEACGIEDDLVRKAEKEAREIIDIGHKEGQSRNQAGIVIRKMITWKMLEEKIIT
jgi:hypothetical protein